MHRPRTLGGNKPESEWGPHSQPVEGALADEYSEVLTDDLREPRLASEYFEHKQGGVPVRVIVMKYLFRKYSRKCSTCHQASCLMGKLMHGR